MASPILLLIVAGTPQAATLRFVPRGVDEAALAAREATQVERSAESWIEDYGSFIVVHGTAEWIPAVAVERGDVVPLDETLHFPGISFDPLVSTPGQGRGPEQGYLSETPDGAEYFVIQLVAPAKDQWLEELRASGVELVQYVPHQAFLVRATATALAAARQNPRVRWIGRYQPAYRLPAALAWVFGGANDATRGGSTSYGQHELATYDIALAGLESLDGMRELLEAAGIVIRHQIELPTNYFNVLRVKMAPDAVAAVAARRGVVTVDPWMPPVAEDELAAQIVAGNYAGTDTVSPGYDPETQFGVTGNNVTISIVDDGIGIPGDGGFYITSSNAVDAPLRGANPGAYGHGHLNATITSGSTPLGVPDANGFNYGLGVAPGSHVVNVPLLKVNYSGTEADTVNDTVMTNGPNGVPGSISNNSWGSGTNNNVYDSMAAQYDGFVRDASTAASVDPLTVIFSAGNSGALGLTRPKVAKNVISVAATENVRPTLPSSIGSTSPANNLEQLPDFSSRGPAADGRVKPDIAAPGDAVTGGRSGPDALFGNIDIFHRVSSGSSHAAPQVAGAAALFTEQWKSGHSGANPSPAMVKAALINSTVDVTGAGAFAARPNGDEGWGRVRLDTILGTGVPMVLLDETAVLASPGDSTTVTGLVADAAHPVRITLTWTDPPGITDPALVNDLDLEVTVGTTSYRGNVLSGGSSTMGGTADTLNNVENVFLPAGIAAGTPIATLVRASALNGDGAVGAGDATDQHFALVVFNAVETTTAVPVAGGSALVGENCAPANGAPDPNEGVAVSLCVENLGTAATGDLVGTLLASGGVTAPSEAPSYGAVPTGGSEVCREFLFGVEASAPCGSTVIASLQLQDGATDFGTVEYAFQVGTPVPAGPTGFANSNSIDIPSSGTATPYPSIITVSALTGTISDVDVTLTSFDHTYPGDVDIVLVGPAGQRIQLMSDRGDATDAVGVDLTFDDEAPGLVVPSVSGSYRPSPGTFSGPSPAGPFGVSLSEFDGSVPNGDWSLYVYDDVAGESGDISGGWSLSISTSEPLCNSGCEVPVELQAFDVE